MANEASSDLHEAQERQEPADSILKEEESAGEDQTPDTEAIKRAIEDESPPIDRSEERRVGKECPV